METYSIINNFGGIEPNIAQLDTEIKANVSITTTLNGISKYADIVEIVFISTLSGPEKTVLDGIVAAHVPVYIPSTDKKLNISCKTNSNKASFTRVATEMFLGSTYATAKCISYMSSNSGSYDVQIFDKTNKQVLLAKNLTNNTEDIMDLGVLSNLSISPIQVEISIKRNGANATVYIESVTIVYN